MTFKKVSFLKYDWPVKYLYVFSVYKLKRLETQLWSHRYITNAVNMSPAKIASCLVNFPLFCSKYLNIQYSIAVVQWLSHVRFFETPGTVCSTSGCPLYYLPEFAQTHIHRVNDSIQPLKIKLVPFEPEISLLGLDPKELKWGSQRQTCIAMFTVALFLTGKMWKQPKCLLTNEWS